MTRLALISLVLFVTMTALAHEQFCIAKDGKAATIVVDENDWKGVIRAANDLNNIRWLEVNFVNTTPGKHRLKLIMIDPEIVIETIVVNPDNNRYSYFGAPARTE